MVEAAGFLALHMGAHILAMNVGAPLVVLIWRLLAGRSGAGSPRLIAPAAALQMVLLWGWHMPAPMALAYAMPGGQLLMHGSLFAAALLFWQAILNDAEAARWRALGALLVTGKLFCLLGALLTFAPRELYLRAAEICFGAGFDRSGMLADQQLAGLVMLIACPITYVAAGIIIAARWIADIERRSGPYLLRENG